MCSPMKKSIMVVGLFSISLFAFAVNAQGNTLTSELKVTGEIVAPKCSVLAPDNGIYDFGQISVTLIKRAATTDLAPITKTWSVTCEEDTYLSFSVVDNRVGTAAIVGASNFGLGMVNGRGKVGYFKAKMTDPKVDGTAAKIYSSPSGSLNDFTIVNGDANFTRGRNLGWGSNTAMRSGKTFTSNIVVTPTLASMEDMGGPITDNVVLDGSMTMTFSFGL